MSFGWPTVKMGVVGHDKPVAPPYLALSEVT
jgi:hypothetical protein